MRHQAIGYTLVIALAFIPSALAKAQDSSPDRHSAREFSGLADYYHHKLYGQKTASGELLKKEKLTAAHRTLPFGTKVKITNQKSGRSCVVVINDRGPFTAGKVIDVSHEAAKQLDFLREGTSKVACLVLNDNED